ncbi:MAG: HAD family hydrolase [Candidatus Woesearchaeota archaeon]|nr:HAD family hydrolase [Candidatus Woesearchaeota archaeon]
MIKAIIFDFWGTVMNNGVFPSPFKQVKYFLRLNMPFSEFAPRFEEAFMLKRFENLYEGFKAVANAFKVNPPDFVYDKLVGVWNKNKLLARPYPEAIEALAELKRGYKLALVSNTDCFGVNELLDKYDMRKFFDVIALSFEVGALKTDKKMFEYVIKKLKVKKNEVIMVGDSIESDMVGAENIGIKGILIDRSNKREYPIKVQSLSEIEDAINRIKEKK